MLQSSELGRRRAVESSEMLSLFRRPLPSTNTHDLATVKAIADSIAVMYQGKIVRYGTKTEVLAPPYDDYTDLLLSSVPEMELGWLENAIARRKMASAGN